MKILHVIPSIDPALGGPTQVVLNLVRALREHGIDAEIATTNDRGSELLDVPLNQRVEYEQVPIWFFPRFSPPIKEFIFSAALTRWLWQHARDYDLIETHYLFSYAPACAALIARLQGIPYAVRTMGQLTPWALSQSWLKKRIYSFLIERHNLNCAEIIHCTAPGEAEDVRNFGIQTPSFTLPLGVNRPIELPDAKQKLYETYGIPTSTPVVLFLSRLHPKKRPDLLIHALSQLVAQNDNFHLILAGSGEPQYLNYLTDLVSSLGLSSRTSIAGFVMGRDKDLLLQASDLFVLPSFSENFGIAVAEAMSVGLPVVVTPDIQISPEIAAASAGLVVEGEIEPLTNAIAQLLSSPELRQQLGENGRLLASQRYSWQAIAQNLISIYTAAIERQPIPTTFSDSGNFVMLP
ncbi:glycosyltransferase [Scytonema millei]|uniref:Glycosyltransferase n=1 Tax=Scytonema millei VB511283 TaxID=1245923 RepID=A0A9X5EA92_9CYAN|nr:glycosyltransferase [Scytonema millei]NHC38185.1 glycosyltransferase [Scytonema millei VB511283]